jgi:hypothetical protein
MTLRILQFTAVTAAVYFALPFAFDWHVDLIQAATLTLLTYLVALIFAGAQTEQEQQITVVITKEDE